MVRNKIKIDDLRRFEFVSDPQVSPDGKYIAFVLSRIDHDRDAYERHIWMADTSSGEVRQFTYGTSRDTYPRWSPDGQNLLFLSMGRDEKKKAQAWTIPRSGGESQLAFEADEGVAKPLWAPDSKQVLFLSNVWTEKKPQSDVKVIKRIKYKLNGVGTFEGRRTHLFKARIRGKPKQLTNGEFDVDAAKWSPDGRNIAFVANMEEDADTNRVRDIFIIPSSGSQPQKVTQGKHVITDLSWSPNEDKIAFIGHDRPKGQTVNLNVWVMPSKGGNMHNITKGFDRTLSKEIGSDLRVSTPNPGVVWSHDGKSIYFVTASIPYSEIYNVDIHGHQVKRVVGGRTIDGFSITHDDSLIAFNAMDATHPAELWTKDEKGERQITKFNDKLLEELDLSVPEHFTFRNSAKEEIDGWVIRPIDYRDGEKYPAVLEIHGGPGSVYGDAIFQEFQLLAAEGYTVLYTNPRGSGGYGEDYADAVMGHYGERDYEDLMTFMDEALTRFPFLDSSKLGVTGGSYGGYMTNWIVSHTTRFKVAVTDRSVCNWVSKFGCSDIGYTQPENIAGDTDYWENMKKHLDKSPIKYAKNVKTPTLITQSENDLRCPIGQAEEWFVALKLQGVATELVRFPEENHELSRSGKPKHREERFEHILRWFSRYLKEP